MFDIVDWADQPNVVIERMQLGEWYEPALRTSCRGQRLTKS